jgi:hypothetical protein
LVDFFDKDKNSDFFNFKFYREKKILRVGRGSEAGPDGLSVCRSPVRGRFLWHVTLQPQLRIQAHISLAQLDKISKKTETKKN